MEQYYLCTDGTVICRFGCRNLAYVVDRTITALGFAGAEYIDWENLKELTLGAVIVNVDVDSTVVEVDDTLITVDNIG